MNIGLTDLLKQGSPKTGIKMLIPQTMGFELIASRSKRREDIARSSKFEVFKRGPYYEKTLDFATALLDRPNKGYPQKQRMMWVC